MSSRRDTSRPILLLALALLTFLPGVGRRDIVTSHEARVVQTSRQMAESGWPWDAKPVQVPQSELRDTPDGKRLLPRADGATMQVNPWVVPVMNGQPRLQKPPLPYWCTAVLYRVVGYSEFTSRIIPALMGAIAVLLVWDVTRHLLGRVAAWYAGLIWISSYFVVDEFRKSMADPYLAFFVVMCVWAWVRGRFSGFCPPHAGGYIKWIIVFYVSMGLGTLSKGPIIFLFVPVILAAIWVCYPKSRSRQFSTSVLIAHLVGVLVFVAIASPWAIAVIRSVPNAVELWRYESLGALSDKSENARPWWFYLPNLFLVTLPWTPLWVMGLILPFKFPKRRRLFAVLSVGVLLVVFSCSHAKKNAYLLPLMFVNAMIVAEALRWLTLIPRRRPVRLAVFRTTVTAVAFSVAVQVFVSVIQPWQGNARSPRHAMGFARARADASEGRESILYSRLPDEATVYLPLNPQPSTSAREFLIIADERRPGAAIAQAKAITSTPAGPVISVEEVPFPDATGKRWNVFKLTVER